MHWADIARDPFVTLSHLSVVLLCTISAAVGLAFVGLGNRLDMPLEIVRAHIALRTTGDAPLVVRVLIDASSSQRREGVEGIDHAHQSWTRTTWFTSKK